MGKKPIFQSSIIPMSYSEGGHDSLKSLNLVKLYDTTLRDGSQAEDISFSLEDKVRIAQKLDELGIHYIEGGWPGSNPKDLQFFQEIKTIPLTQAKVVAFGSTCRAGTSPQKDPNIKALIEAGTEGITIFGKS